MIKFILFFSLVFNLLANDELYKAFTNKDYKKAFKILTKESEKGDMNAKYNLALMYYQGDGTDINVTKTAELLDQAASMGHKKAIQNVGRIYMQLLKFDKASFWLEKSAEQGDKEAYYLLAEIYCEQEKFPHAKKWAKKSMDSGNIESKELWDRYHLENY
jgi:TPR repeat protein